MYKIVGGDQREYGPATSEQVREWVATGRANGQTLASFEGSPWKPLSTFPEFADALRTATPPTLPPGLPGFGGAGQGYVAARSNNLAVAGLVLSVLGLCCSPLAIAGFVCSVMGLVQISKNPQEFSTSKVVPIIGIVLSGLAVLGTIIFFVTGGMAEIMKNMPR